MMSKLTNAVENRVMTKEEREDKHYLKIIEEMNNRLHKLQPYFVVISESVQAAVHKKKQLAKLARKSKALSR